MKTKSVGFSLFDFDMPRAVMEQLIEQFDTLNEIELTTEALKELRTFQHQQKSKQGVYMLYYNNALVYVGKTNKSLVDRLGKHLFKLSGRQGIKPKNLAFKCLYLEENWRTLTHEEALINHYKGAGSCEWNQSGFGNNDPGHDRDTTHWKPEGFDAKYPINPDYEIDVEARQWDLYELLTYIKTSLPYLLRFQREDKAKGKTAHPDYRSRTVSITSERMSAGKLLRSVTDALGANWQLTVLPGYMILYKEHREYKNAIELYRPET